MRASEKTRRLTGLALMTAIIVVLQVVASFVKFGPFTITLALAPILIGAALYRPEGQARAGRGIRCRRIVGLHFGLGPRWSDPVECQSLPDRLGLLGQGHPGRSGCRPGLSGHRLGRQIPQQRSYAGRLLAAGIVSPVVNTGLFLLGLFFLFPTYLEAWATGAGRRSLLI